MTTITQYGIDSADGYQGCGLYKYSTTSANFYSSPLLQGDGGSSDVSREELGVCNSSIALRQKKRQAEAAAKKAEENKTELQRANDAVRRDPSNGELWRDLAHAQERQGQLDAAKISIDRALGLNPSDPYVLLTGGHIEARHGRPNTAVAMIKKAIELRPDEIEKYYYHLGFVYLKEGDYEQALLPLKTSTDLAPNSSEGFLSEALKHRGLVLFELGVNINGAIQSWRESLLYREKAETMLALAAALHQEKADRKEFISLAGHALVKNPNFVNQDYQQLHFWGERLRSAAAALLEDPALKYPAKMAKANATWKKR